MAANEANIHKWFVDYRKVLHDLNITSPVQIWSGDEAGIQNIPKRKRSSVRNVNQPIEKTISVLSDWYRFFQTVNVIRVKAFIILYLLITIYIRVWAIFNHLSHFQFSWGLCNLARDQALPVEELRF